MQTTGTYHTIPVHKSAHFDEAVGVALIQKYGEQNSKHSFPGAATAKIRTVESDPIGGDARFDRDGLLPIGCGHGRFDDKRPDGTRKEGECSATLVAKELGIHTDPVLVPLLAETLRCDTKPGVRNTQLPEIIKMGNVALGKAGEKFILTWATSVVLVLIEQSANRYASVNGEKGALDFFEQFLKQEDTEFKNEKAVAFLRRQLEKAAEYQDSVTELDYVCRALQRCGKAEMAAEVALFAFTNLYHAQLQIQRLVDDYRELKSTERGRCELIFANAQLGPGREERSLRILLVHSDEPFVHRAASYLHYDITAVRRSTGHVQLFANSKVKHLSIGTAMAMLRWLDLPKNAKGEPVQKFRLEQLRAAGKIETVAHWFYFAEAEMGFNGSRSHDDPVHIPATKISSQAIVEVLEHAFHPRLIARWKAERGIEYGCRRDDRQRRTQELKTKEQNAHPREQRHFKNWVPSWTKPSKMATIP